MTLTKADIVARVYAQGIMTKAEASDAVERSMDLIKSSLEREQEVLVSGFGKWSVRRKAERRGRNPQTGDPLILPARKVVTFRPSRVLKAKVQRGTSQAEAPYQTEAPAKTAQSSREEERDKVLKHGYF